MLRKLYFKNKKRFTEIKEILVFHKLYYTVATENRRDKTALY